MSEVLRARLLVAGAALLFSTGGTGIKATAFTAPQVACFRAGTAALVLALLLPEARRGFGLRPFLVGLCYAATGLLFVHSNKLTTAANSIFLQSTAPIWVLALSARVLGEPVKRRDWAFLAALAAGMTLFFVGSEPPRATATAPLVGNGLSAAAGLTSALMMLGLRWLGRGGGGGALPAAMTGNLIIFAVQLPLALPAHGSPRDWAIVAFLGSVQIATGYALLIAGLRHVPAVEASLLLFLEPVVTPLWAWLLHGERQASWALAGSLLIAAATFARAALDLPAVESRLPWRRPGPAAAALSGDAGGDASGPAAGGR